MKRHLTVVVLAALAASCCVVPANAAAADTCSNAAVREEQASSFLPDCRAYEQVSAVDKVGTDVFLEAGHGNYFVFDAAPDGNAAMYQARAGFADAPTNFSPNSYVAFRGPGGWSTHSTNVARNSFIDVGQFFGLSEDFTQAALVAGDPVRAPGARAGVPNFYVKDVRTGAMRTLSTGTQADAASFSSYAYYGGSRDLRYVLFADSNRQTADAPVTGEPNIYLAHDGQVELVSILPDGAPAPAGAVAGSGFGGNIVGAISDDGSRVFFTTPDGRLYVRLEGKETVEVSASQKAAPDLQLPATFQLATPSGSYVYFYTEEQLLDSDTNSGEDIYRYEVSTGSLVLISGQLTAPRLIASVADGSRVYFAGETASGVNSIFVWDQGTVVMAVPDIGSALGLLPRDLTLQAQIAEISTDGRRLAFASEKPLVPEVDSNLSVDLYLYDFPSGGITCISCHGDGTAGVVFSRFGKTLGSAPGTDSEQDPHLLSADGRRVFFSTQEAMVPADSNGRIDAYQWSDENVQLLSSGTSEANSYFVSASESGDDAFFTTRQRLTASDLDQNVDLYDARVGGGFATTVRGADCQGQACQGSAGAGRPLAALGSSRFAGPGNHKSCRARAKKPRREKSAADRRAKASVRQKQRVKRCASRTTRTNRRQGASS